MEFGADFWTFVAIGVFAQLVDGALGMAFGVIGSSVLMATGVAPAQASAMIQANTVRWALNGLKEVKDAFKEYHHHLVRGIL